jgi:hypothetical protein
MSNRPEHLQKSSQPFASHASRKFGALLVRLGVAIGVALFTGHAVGTLIAAALGQSIASKEGQSALVMGGVMMLATLAWATTGRRARLHPRLRSQWESYWESQLQCEWEFQDPSPAWPDLGQRELPVYARSAMFGRLICHISAALIVGVYYGGTLVPPAQQALGAGMGALLAGGLAAWLSPMHRGPVQVGLASLRTVVIYGGAFLQGAVGCMLLSVGQGWGLLLLGLMVWSLGVTVRSGRDGVQWLRAN